MRASEVAGECESVDVVFVRGVGRKYRLIGADEVEAVWLGLDEEYAGFAREQKSWRFGGTRPRPARHFQYQFSFRRRSFSGTTCLG